MPRLTGHLCEITIDLPLLGHVYTEISTSPSPSNGQQCTSFTLLQFSADEAEFLLSSPRWRWDGWALSSVYIELQIVDLANIEKYADLIILVWRVKVWWGIQ